MRLRSRVAEPEQQIGFTLEWVRENAGLVWIIAVLAVALVIIVFAK
jgi:hypothetical protein